MKKIAKALAACSLALLLCVCLVACEASYSATEIKNKLTNAGYTVSESYDIEFDDETKASQLPGIQKIYTVVKGEGADKEVSIFLVFDSIRNAENGVPDQKLVSLFDEARSQSGTNKKGDITGGRYNNVVFAGSQVCRNAAGI